LKLSHANGASIASNNLAATRFIPSPSDRSPASQPAPARAAARACRGSGFLSLHACFIPQDWAGASSRAKFRFPDFNSTQKETPNEPLSERHQRRSGDQYPACDLASASHTFSLAIDRFSALRNRFNAVHVCLVVRANARPNSDGLDAFVATQNVWNTSICWRVIADARGNLLVGFAETPTLFARKCVFRLFNRIAGKVIIPSPSPYPALAGIQNSPFRAPFVQSDWRGFVFWVCSDLREGRPRLGLFGRRAANRDFRSKMHLSWLGYIELDRQALAASDRWRVVQKRLVWYPYAIITYVFWMFNTFVINI